MNIDELTAPLPKPWLNITANSITTDRLLVRGSHPALSKFACTSSSTVLTNTTNVTSFWSSMSGVGSPLFSLPILTGTTAKVRSTLFIANIAVGSTLTIGLRSNATTLMSRVLTGPLVNVPCILEAEIVIQSSTVAGVSYALFIDGAQPVLGTQSVGYASTVPMLLDLFGAFNVASPANQAQATMSSVVAMFRD